MIPRLSSRHGFTALAVLGVGFLGCGEAVSPTPTSVVTTPSDVINPEPGPVVDSEAPSADALTPAAEPTPAVELEPAPVPEEADTQAPGDLGTPEPEAAVVPRDLTSLAEAAVTEAPEPDASSSTGVELVPMTFDEYLSKAVTKPEAKLTVVDAWATWCGPCKENFPHLVEMHEKYGSEGLNVVSLSMDDPTDEAAVKEAKAFLEQMKATFTNVLLKEDFGVGFERLNINAIPSVFLYGPDGREVRRFTLDDTENQFTYEEVDEVVALLLKGEELPEDAPGEAPPAGK